MRKTITAVLTSLALAALVAPAAAAPHSNGKNSITSLFNDLGFKGSSNKGSTKSSSHKSSSKNSNGFPNLFDTVFDHKSKSTSHKSSSSKHSSSSNRHSSSRNPHKTNSHVQWPGESNGHKNKPKKNKGGHGWGHGNTSQPGSYRLVSPAYEIHTDHDDPYGPCGAFFIELTAGNQTICVFEGPQVGMTIPAVYEYVPGDPVDCLPALQPGKWAKGKKPHHSTPSRGRKPH